MIAKILRTETSTQGTFGILTTDNGFTCYTGELMWDDNIRGHSCIPAGTYQCVWHHSPSKGWVYEVTNVPNRSDILIHIANYCGQVPEYKCDLLGCIGLGARIGELMNQKAILQSGLAIADFNVIVNKQPFTLEISWQDGVGENNS